MAIHQAVIYLRARDAAQAIAFYERAFGAKQTLRINGPGERVGHAELALDQAVIMLSDEYPQFGVLAPSSERPAACTFHLEVDDADAVIAQAVAAGAEMLMPPQDHFYGQRAGTIRDPFGYDWMIGHWVERVEPAELQRRFDAMMAGGEAS